MLCAFTFSGDDETFQDIFRDFSNMASHNPEKLSRRQFSRSAEEEDEGNRLMSDEHEKIDGIGGGGEDA